MNHGVFGRKLHRDVGQRRRLFMQLTRALITNGRLKTTLSKAKAVQPGVDKLITKAKTRGNAAVSELRKSLADEAMVTKLTDMAKTRFDKRTSGYTRIIRLGKRYGDAAEEVLLEFVDAELVPIVKAVKTAKTAEAKPKVEEAQVVNVEKAPKATSTKKSK